MVARLARESAARITASVGWRAWQRYGLARGTVLGGGVAYAAFFSIFPALAVGFTVFGVVLGSDSELQGRVVETINNGFGTPLIIAEPGGPGLIDIATLTGAGQLTAAGSIGIIGLLFTGLGWLDAMREGIRAMFGQPPEIGRVVFTKLRDLGVLVTIGVVVVCSAVGGVAVNSVTGRLLEAVGLDGSATGRVLLQVAGILVLLAVDVVVFLVLFRMLAGVRLPNRDLLEAALVGGVGLGLLKLFGGLLLARASSNTLLATFAVAVGLLIWLNLVARLTLLGASWGAVVALDRGHLRAVDSAGGVAAEVVDDAGPAETAGAGAARRPPAGPAARPALRPAASGARPVAAVPYTPVVSPRAADRVSVAAGAVLGAAGMALLRTAGSAVRSAVSAIRR